MYSTVKVLDNFYDDVRPKVVIFPNSALVTNFYSELEKFQNIPGCKHAQFAERYLDFFDRQRQYPEVTGFLTVIFLLWYISITMSANLLLFGFNALY